MLVGVLLVTDVALVWLYARVLAGHVALHVGLNCEALATHSALVLEDAHVLLSVKLKRPHCAKAIVTYGAFERPVISLPHWFVYTRHPTKRHLQI